MTRKELLEKSDELTIKWMDKKAKLDKYIQQWINQEIVLDEKSLQELIDNVEVQIEKLKKESNKYRNEYLRITQEEVNYKNAVITVRHQFGLSPSDIKQTDNILSSNPNQSTLSMKVKTDAEIKCEKNILLTRLKEKVMNKEITLAKAAELSRTIINIYSNKNKKELKITKSI